MLLVDSERKETRESVVDCAKDIEREAEGRIGKGLGDLERVASSPELSSSEAGRGGKSLFPIACVASISRKSS